MMKSKARLRREIKSLLAQTADTARDPLVSFDQPHSIFRPASITEELITPQTCATLFGYVPLTSEADPRSAMRIALERGISVGVPRLYGKEMRFHQITSLCGPFETNTYGISEPPVYRPCLFAQDLTVMTKPLAFPLLILVPALAFSHEGTRLGRGGGYYDRFLSALLTRYSEQRNQITLAGVCHTIQILEKLPQEHHDISVDCLYT